MQPSERLPLLKLEQTQALQSRAYTREQVCVELLRISEKHALGRRRWPMQQVSESRNFSHCQPQPRAKADRGQLEIEEVSWPDQDIYVVIGKRWV